MVKDFLRFLPAHTDDRLSKQTRFKQFGPVAVHPVLDEQIPFRLSTIVLSRLLSAGTLSFMDMDRLHWISAERGYFSPVGSE
jgi:hypothetical protein